MPYLLRFYVLLFYLIINSSCIFLPNKVETVGFNGQFYIGRSSTHYFQKITSDIFRNSSYTISEYYNSSTESKISTNWKINYVIDIDSNDVEYKTRFILVGLIDNTSFNKTRSFNYECYLETENYYFNGNEYIEEYSSKFIIEEMNKIKEELRISFKK